MTTAALTASTIRSAVKKYIENGTLISVYVIDEPSCAR